MKLPILNLLKRREYQELSRFQDAVVDILYSTDSSIVLHGGTAIWRCFSGSRFSSDIDAYVSSKGELDLLKKTITSAADGQGIKVEKAKDTGNLIFMAFSSGSAYLKVELNYAKGRLKPVATRFERVDGTYMEVLTLSPEDLILEKISAYSDRRFIRDIYDIYILCDYVSDPSRIRKRVIGFISNIKEPVNKAGLEALVYTGPVPTFSSMVRHISGRFS